MTPTERARRIVELDDRIINLQRLKTGDSTNIYVGNGMVGSVSINYDDVLTLISLSTANIESMISSLEEEKAFLTSNFGGH